MNAIRTLALALLASAVLICSSPSARAQGKNSASVVKATAKGMKSAGKTAVTITLDVNSKYHIYANPVDNKDLESAQTTVTFTAGGKPVDAKVEYPAGELKKEKVGGDYKVYNGKVTIKATVASTEALEASVQLQACSKSVCLLPAKIKVKVD